MILNFPSNLQIDNSNQLPPMKGTTALALKYSDGSIIVSDRRASMGTFVGSKKAKKVYLLNDYTGLGTAGLVSDAQALVDLMKSELRLYKLENNFDPSVKVAGSLLATILHGGYRRYQPWWVQLLVTGVDRRGTHVYNLGPAGSLSEEDYFAVGSGMMIAMGVMEVQWKPGLAKDEAKDLAVTALKASIARDNATGNGIDGLIFSTKKEAAEIISIDL
ncbi:MAG: proteasome subunit beta [Candidatus Thorarchaeota archaeon]